MNDLQNQIQALIDEMVESGSENGVQAAVCRNGALIVDAVSGVADHETGRPVTSDTVFYSASTGKGATATVVHVLVEQGVLTYDTPVVEVWPEFGAHGKSGATLRHVLTHSVGVPGVPMDTTVEQLSDWHGMCHTIAQTPPWWLPGEKVGYHALTYGYIVGEIVRRATGKPISQVLADEVAGPLGVADELYFAVPASELARVARLEDDPAGQAMFASLPADWPLFQTGPRALFPGAEYGNRREVLTSDIPAGATLSARAIARMYGALLGEVDGVRLVSSDRLREISTLATAGHHDEMTGYPATYALGYTVGRPGLSDPKEHPTAFGFVGVGGSAAYADIASGVSVAVTKNRFNPVEINAFERVSDLVAEEFA